MKKLLLGVFLLAMAAFVIAIPRIERNAAERIRNRVPADSVSVHLVDLHVRWYGLDWNGIVADSASLTVPLRAAFTHFATGKPVSAGKIEAWNAVLDIHHEEMKPLKSAFTLGGIRKRRVNVETAVLNGRRTPTGFHIVAADVASDMGRFRYQGDLENLRFVNGRMRISQASRSLQVVYFNMASLTGGAPTRTPDGDIDIIW